ncbi:MAG TPA: hypothetical protein VG295_06345 [Solirubrobacteraceae bacterium]|jgi:hypothetical protein|nr:hypothetical protein [Solirubrobacteraceae bacterium]
MTGIVDVGGWVAPAMELIYEQGTPAFRGQWPKIEALLELAASRPAQGDWPHPALALPAEPSRRLRADAWGAAGAGGAEPGTPAGHGPVPAGVLHDNAPGRVAALDDAGVTLQLISPGPSIDAVLQLPANLGAGVFAAYNRYITAYTSAHPHRLGAVLQLHGSEPRWSAHEVAELRGEPSVRAVSVCLPVRISPEDGHFDPLWTALEDADLPLLHRPALCARIWSPARLLAYLESSGVLARHPGLRVAFLDGSSGALDGLAGRLFVAAGAAELRPVNAPGAADRVWASDYPLRGALRSELEAARRALGPERAQEALVAAPARFLGGQGASTGPSHDQRGKPSPEGTSSAERG